MSGLVGQGLVGPGPGRTSNHGAMSAGKHDNQVLETALISIGRLMIGRLILLISYALCL